MRDDEIDEYIRNTLSSCIPLLSIALVAVLISLATDILCKEGEPRFWFQRSGSIMVLMTAWVEYKLSRINADINPPPSGYVAELKWREKYGKRYKTISYVALGFIVLGTFIWGYGDIPFKAI